jgi:hypothetical protein
MRARTMILLRATRASPRLLAFAEMLREASGYQVALVLDARFAGQAEGFDTLLIDRAQLRSMGFYCPNNFAWRCGDYGFYLAADRFPDIAHFWMIEHDVRFTADGLDAFFKEAEGNSADFLAAHLRAAEPDWFWSDFASGRGVQPMRCLFPVSRLSRPAIEVLRERRITQGRSRLRQWLWPNDEVFVATTLKTAGLDCRDLNDGPVPVYDAESFGYFRLIEGARFERELRGAAAFRIFHPVLYDEDYARKQEKLTSFAATGDTWRRRRNRLAARILSLTRW